MLLDIPVYYLTQLSLLYGIISMEAPSGKQLPSRLHLANIYSTSENTIRKVLSALSNQGIIDHGKGHAPRILFDPSNVEHWRNLKNYYPIQTAKIGDIVDAYRLIVPPFLLLGIAKMKREEISSLLEKFRAVLDGPPEDFWSLSCFYLATLLYASKNSTVTYYYIVTQITMHCAYHTISPGDREKIIQSRKKLFVWLVQNLSQYLTSREAPSIGKLSNAFDWYYHQITPLLKKSTALFSNETVKPLFSDFQQKHMQVCFEMAHRVFSGQFASRATLPSDTLCAAHFDVAITTARRAYRLLGEMGFSETVARVGTLAIFPPAAGSALYWEKNEIKQYFPSFLDQMEFFRRHIRRVALLSAQRSSTLCVHLRKLEISNTQSSPRFWGFFFVEYVQCVFEQYGNESYTYHFALTRSLLYFGLGTLDQVVAGCVEKVCRNWIRAVSLLEKGEFLQFATDFSSGWKYLDTIAASAFPGGSIPVKPFPIWKIESPSERKEANH